MQPRGGRSGKTKACPWKCCWYYRRIPGRQTDNQNAKRREDNDNA